MPEISTLDLFPPAEREISTQNLFAEDFQGIEDPIKAGERSDIAFDLSTERNVPYHEAQQLIAGPEPSLFGKQIQKVKDFLNEKAGFFEPPLYGGPEFREEHKLKTIAQFAARTTAEVASGLSLMTADVLTNKITGDKTLAEMVDRVSGFTPTPQEETAGIAAKYIGAFTTARKGVGLVVGKIPAAAALKTILSAGLTFGSVEAAMQFSKNITEGRPVDWSSVHFSSGIGVLWGTGQVAVAAAISGLAKGFEKHWGARDIELAKSGLKGKTLQQQKAIQAAEKIRDIQRAKDSIRAGKGVPQDLRDKYISPPKEGVTKPTKPTTTPAKPPVAAPAQKVAPTPTAVPPKVAVVPQPKQDGFTVTKGKAGGTVKKIQG